MATITKVWTSVVSLPLYHSLKRWKHGLLEKLDHVLVHVELSSGVQGVAEVPVRPTIYGETVESVRAMVDKYISPLLVGEELESHRMMELSDICAMYKNNHCALWWVNIALHDALRNHLDVSWQVYMPRVIDKVQVSYILWISDIDSALAHAMEVYEKGVRVFKVKVGKDWVEDIERLQILKRDLPNDAEIYTDANELFSVSNAEERLQVLKDEWALYCEEPLPVSKIIDRSHLQNQKILPIIGDDSCFTPNDLDRELEEDTFDILNIKTARTWWTVSREMVRKARERNKQIMVWSQASAWLWTMHTALFSAAVAADTACELSFFVNVKEDVCDWTLQLREWYIYIDDVYRQDWTSLYV